MPVVLTDLEARTRIAVATYWTLLASQKSKQTSGDADRGGRSAVTGGKQMQGFCQLIHRVLVDNGLPEAHIFLNKKLELPGYFRSTKGWDLLIVHEGRLVAALEMKSQCGPSFGNNFNNRTEEAIGSAQDFWTAYREEAFGRGAPRPWLGWLILVEDCPKSRTPVKVAEPHFPAFPEFQGASYVKRYEILGRKLMLENLYNSSCVLLSIRTKGKKGQYEEAAPDVGIRPFLASLAGHVGAYVATI